MPNPFNPTTTIEYSLAAKSNLTLSIYNVLGKKIRTLINEERSQGSYSVVWDGKDDFGRPVSAGIYIYIVEAIPLSEEEAEPFRASGKMLLAK